MLLITKVQSVSIECYVITLIIDGTHFINATKKIEKNLRGILADPGLDLSNLKKAMRQLKNNFNLKLYFVFGFYITQAAYFYCK